MKPHSTTFSYNLLHQATSSCTKLHLATSIYTTILAVSNYQAGPPRPPSTHRPFRSLLFQVQLQRQILKPEQELKPVSEIEPGAEHPSHEHVGKAAQVWGSSLDLSDCMLGGSAALIWQPARGERERPEHEPEAHRCRFTSTVLGSALDLSLVHSTRSRSKPHNVSSLRGHFIPPKACAFILSTHVEQPKSRRCRGWPGWRICGSSPN